MKVELIHDIWVVAQVVLLDLALGGDNSIVIGMACKSLPRDMQKKAIIYGTAGAIILRFIMAAAVVSLMFVGAVEIVLAAAGSRRAARIVALVGFAVQALAVVLFASTMQPYATTLMFVLLLAKVVVGYRILRS